MFKKLLILLNSSSLLLFFAFGVHPPVANAEANLISDGFDYPVGKPDGTGYCVEGCYGLAFLEKYDYMKDGVPEFHPGEDWNDDNSGLDFGNNRDDKGDPVYAVSNGVIKFAKFGGTSWGYLVLIEHTLPNGEKYWSQYAHLASITENFYKKDGAIVGRGETIGFVGDYPYGYNTAHHLHFEIRKKYRRAEDFVGNWKIEQVLEYYVDPSEFIDTHRPLRSDPINLTASNTGYDKTTLSWNKPTFQNFDKYELLRSSFSNGTFDSSARQNLLTEDFSKNIDNTSHADSGLSPNSDYYYRLLAYSSSGLYISTDEFNVKTNTAEINLSHTSGAQIVPRINGRYIVWQDNKYNPQIGAVEPVLHTFDTLENINKNFDVSVANSAFPQNPEIYQNKVVYSAKRKNFSGYGDLNIYYFDLEKEGGTGVPITEDPGDQTEVDIYKNYVVWEDQKNILNRDTSIGFIDLSKGGGPRTIVDNPGLQRYPKIWETKLVYVDNTTGEWKKDQIKIYDLVTGETVTLPGYYSEAKPSFDSGIISWIHNKEIYIFNLQAQSLQKLSVGMPVTRQITKDNKIFFETWPAYGAGSIDLYDIVTGQYERLVHDLAYSSWFDYHNGIFVFTNISNFELSPGTSDVFMLRL